MKKLISEGLFEALSDCKQLIYDCENEQLREMSQNELKEVENIQQLEKGLGKWLGNLANDYFKNGYVKYDSENQMEYLVIGLAQTYENKEVDYLKGSLENEVKPIDYCNDYTNGDNQLIDCVSYSFDYFEEKNPNLTTFELEAFKDNKGEYKQHLKEFIINEISDNILND